MQQYPIDQDKSELFHLLKTQRFFKGEIHSVIGKRQVIFIWMPDSSLL